MRWKIGWGQTGHMQDMLHDGHALWPSVLSRFSLVCVGFMRFCVRFIQVGGLTALHFPRTFDVSKSRLGEISEVIYVSTTLIRETSFHISVMVIEDRQMGKLVL